MKNLLYLLLLATLSCMNQTKQVDNTRNIDSTSNIITSTNKIDISKYYTTKDTITITIKKGDSLKYSKEEFNQIIDKHPELVNAKYVQNPDQIYYCNSGKLQFGSEVWQDEFYILYAYFLQQKNGINKYKELRKNLIDIYSNINSLFRHFEYGGTYFGHQSSRILGYAEFSIHLYIENEKNFTKTYDISKEKELYINSLRQIIIDESSIDFNTLGEYKIERNNKLNKIVDDLDKLITSNFYLKRAQDFHYSNYEYY